MSEILQAVRVHPNASPNACVIWLHGLGADGYDFVDVIPNLGLPPNHGIEFIFPHAPKMPVTINGGMVMPAWYDIVAIDTNAPQDEKGIKRTEQALHHLINQIIQEDIAPSRIVLMGFSQGGAVALYTALRYPQPLAGVAGLSTYLPLSAKLDAERSQANQQLPIWLAHGLVDPIVPYWLGQASYTVLKNLGYHPQWHDYPMDHSVCLPELTEIGRWLKGLLC